MGVNMGSRLEVVRKRNIVFVGGLVAVDEAGNLAATDAAGQTKFVFDRLRELLASVGSSPADVIKHTIYFSAPADQESITALLDEVNAVRAGYFPAPGPTTTEVRCGLDTPGALLLLDAWAVVGGEREVLSPPG